jgi:hypothetical protein
MDESDHSEPTPFSKLLKYTTLAAAGKIRIQLINIFVDTRSNLLFIVSPFKKRLMNPPGSVLLK